MQRDPDCIFCKIVAGEIPSFKLWEDADTYAFMDINPANPGHALIIPKAHWPNLFEIPADLLGPVLATTQRVARAVKAVLAPHGLNIVQANGPGAAQSVFHLHVHVVPRGEDDGLRLNWGPKPGDMGKIEAVHRKLLAALD